MLSLSDFAEFFVFLEDFAVGWTEVHACLLDSCSSLFGEVVKNGKVKNALDSVASIEVFWNQTKRLKFVEITRVELTSILSGLVLFQEVFN